jgi:hypothetical protein
MPQQIKKVLISSTALDLPEHRKQIVEACLRQNMFPLRMEDLPANSDEAGDSRKIGKLGANFFMMCGRRRSVGRIRSFTPMRAM